MAGSGSPCGACKFLRRKCVKGCVFAPHFSHEQGASLFAAIHKVFGASNVSKLLSQLPVSQRAEAAVTISYEAQARLHDPIYGCVSHIFHLQQQVINLQALVATLREQAASQSLHGTTTHDQGCPTSSSNSHGKVPFPHHQEAAIHSWSLSEFPNTAILQHNPNKQSNNTEDSSNINLDGYLDHHLHNNSMMRNNIIKYHNNSQSSSSSAAAMHEQAGDGSFVSYEGSSSNYAMSTDHGNFEHVEDRKWPCQDADDLHSVAFGYYGG
ncbi:hypothetical protein Dimus_016828 [Dionaea muscipula]